MPILNLQNLQALAATLDEKTQRALGAVLRAQDKINADIKLLLENLQTELDDAESDAVQLSDDTPNSLGTAAPGTGTTASRWDHVHGHGSLAGGALHAIAVAGVSAGFLSAAGATVLAATSGTNTGDVTLTAVGSSPSANAATLSGQALTLQPADATHPGVLSAAGFVNLSNQSGTNTGDITLGAFGSSPDAKGASLSGQVLTMQPADATHPGEVSLASQTLGSGTKTVNKLVVNDSSGNTVVVNSTDLIIDSTNHYAAFGVTPDRPFSVKGSTSGGTIFSLCYIQNTNSAGASTLAFFDNGGSFQGRVGWVNASSASYASKLVLQSSGVLSLYTGVDASPIEALTFTAAGLGTASQNWKLQGSNSLGHSATPQYQVDLGSTVANTKIALFNNVPGGGSSIAGIGIASGDVRFHGDGNAGKFSWRGSAAGASLMELSTAGVLNIASGGSYTLNGVALPTISSTDTLTNKTLTSPTINSATLSGTLSGNCTLSGNNTYSGTAAMTNTVTFSKPNVYSVTTGITAHAGGGQASATALTTEKNFVSTVASANDSVKLPATVAGLEIQVFNLGANACDVYPPSSSAIDALGTNNPYSLAAGSSKRFGAQTSTQWRSS